MTERCLRYRDALDMLRDAGYVVFGRPKSRAPVVFTRFVVACNLIGEMIGVNPFRVYQSIVCRVEWLSRGRAHNASNSGFVRASGRQEAEALHVFCPCCGADILSAGPVGPSEIAFECRQKAKMRGDSPQKSPHSRESEVEKSPFIGEEVAETGAEGMGGGDPTGAPVPHDPPHSPSH